MRTVKAAAGLALLLVLPAEAMAAPKKGKEAWDPNREICKTRPVVGSRLKRVRECATAQEWEDMKLQEQVGLMRKQTNGDPGGVPIMSGGRDSPW